MEKKKMLTGIAFALSVVLLIGGIVSAVIKYGDGNMGNIEIVKGNAQPEKMKDGGYRISAGDYALELHKTKAGYGVQIKNAAGEVAEEQINPINIQIKKPNAEDDYLGTQAETEMLASDYQKLRLEGNTVVAFAEVKSKAGSVFQVVDQYIGQEDGTYEMARDIKVKKAAAGDEGFNSIVKYKEKDAKTYDMYEYFIPGVISRNSEHLYASSMGANMSLDYTWVRDTNTGLPMAMTRNMETGASFSIGRVIEGKVTTGIDESQGSWVVNKNLDYSSVGVSNVDGYVSMDVCYPGMEGDINYLDYSAQFLKRSHPVRDDVVHQYKVLIQANQSENFTDAMVKAYQTHYNANVIPEVDSDIDKVYDATLELLDTYTQEYAYGRTSYPFALTLNGEVTSLDAAIGFVGQQTSLGFHLTRNGIETGSTQQREKGNAVIDTWVRDGFTEYGFPRVWFVTAEYEWAPETFITCYVRYMSDGMEGILDAYLEEKAAGVEKEKWLERCVQYADWLVKAQNDNGSYYRAYSAETGKVSEGTDGKVSNDYNNTSCPIRYLVRMYEQTGNKAYLDAAVKAGEFVYDNYYMKDTYYGGTPDGDNVVDKEAAIMAMYAFNSLYQATEEDKWLSAAEHAAICSASFIYTFDFSVWGQEQYNIYRETVGTSGLSRIATGMSGVDSFSAYLYYEYFKLYVYTGNEFYYDFAKLIQDNTKQFVCLDGNLPYAKDGIVNEAHVISNMFYSTDVEMCLLWCNIAMIDPIASMEDAFGVNTIEAAKDLGADKLQEMISAYGAGGNFR